MRLLPALALAALLIPFAQAASAVRSDGASSEAERLGQATQFSATPSASIPFTVRSGGYVRFNVYVGAADADGLSVQAPKPCRQDLEASAGDVFSFTCGYMMAGQYSLVLRSEGRATAGALRAYGALFQAPSLPV